MNSAFVRPLAVAAATAALLAGFSACQSSSTTLERDWTALDVGKIHFTKILVIGISPVDSLRKPLEDAMKGEIKTVPTVASYELLPNVADQVDPRKITEAIKANGIDGIITMRMIALEDETKYHAGGEVPVPYQSFSGYYSPGYALSPYYSGIPGPYVGGYPGPMTYEYVPPSVTTTHFLSIETNIYNAATGKLIWSGLTRSKNSDQSDNVIAEIAAVVRGKLRVQKLIP